MKVRELFSMAALAFVLAGCAKEISEPVTSGEIHFTATIAAHGSDTKTSYTEEGDDINVAWVVGDKIALIHNGVKDVATVTSVDSYGRATIEATLTGSPADEDDIRLVYPADAVASTASGTGIAPVQAFINKMLTQDGTLDYIQNIDLRMAMGKIAVQGTDADLKEDVKLESGISIWKFTLQDDASTPNALNATELKIRIGGQLVAKAVDTAKGTFYLGVDAAINTAADVSVEATVGTDTYIYSKGGVSITSSKYYQSTISMTKVDMLTVPLTLEAETAGTVHVSSPKSGMQYSKNGATKAPVTSAAIDVVAGDKVAFFGSGTSITEYALTRISGGTAQVKAYGNVMSLVDETGFATATELTTNGALKSLFYNYTNLTDASGLLLPASTLTEYCYFCMFFGCTSLTSAPALPAETLARECYASMFEGCSSLTTAPTLPAEALAEYCYYCMFSGCTSLTSAPALPAETLAEGCYYGMFLKCENLTSAPTTLPATTLAESCYYYMFEECTSLTTAPELPASTLKKNCYSHMFYGCTKLSSVTCLATNISALDCTSEWLSGVATSGTFTTPNSTGWEAGDSGIPDEWMRVDYDPTP